jgi:hypothetical protein
MTATSATLKLENQKNGWKGMCIHQQINGEQLHCPVRTLGWRVAHIRKYSPHPDTFLSAFFTTATDGKTQRFDVTDDDIRTSVKRAAVLLKYHET